MTRKYYQAPSMLVVSVSTQNLLAGSEVTDVVSGDTGIGYGGGGSGPAYGRSRGNWGDDEEF